jgi:HEPN domain-containing protein
VTNRDLAAAYLLKAEKRLKALKVLRDEEAHSDVMREAQEIVELALKAMLRAVGVEPPKYHDVGGLLQEHREKFDEHTRGDLSEAAKISKRLRKEREISFSGDIDFIPTEEYDAEDSARAYDGAEWIVALARRAIGLLFDS